MIQCFTIIISKFILETGKQLIVFLTINRQQILIFLFFKFLLLGKVKSEKNVKELRKYNIY